MTPRIDNRLFINAGIAAALSCTFRQLDRAAALSRAAPHTSVNRAALIPMLTFFFASAAAAQAFSKTSGAQAVR
jgi:hypothetical protein